MFCLLGWLTPVFDTMLELGADVNALGYRNMSLETPLHLVARIGAEPLVRWFIDNGADPTVLDGAGRTAAAIAKAKGYDDIYGMLSVGNAVRVNSAASEQVEHSGHSYGGDGDRGDGDIRDEDGTCDFDVIDVENWTESIFFERYFESHRPVLVKGFAGAKWQRYLFV